jgi:hypothetical protein
VERQFVVEGNLFARLDIPECEKQNVTIEYFHVAVRLAGVINVMRAISTSAAIEAPALINCANTEAATASPAVSFGIGDSLAGILCYLSASRKVRT